MLYGVTRANLVRALEEAKRSNARAKMINVRVTHEELALIEAAAGVHGLAVATFMRVVVFAAIKDLAIEKGGRHGSM